MSDNQQSRLPHRTLGKTGVQVPVLGYGTATVGKIEEGHPSFEGAVKLLHYAIDNGITYLDTSPDYGSQPRVGEVMKTRRDEVFLATKVNKRKREDALREMHQNLKELQTDHVDLVQVHAVNTMSDLEAALAPDGVLTALEEARRQGMTRFVGITGHARPSVLAYALERYDFDTVLVATGAVDRLVNGPEDVLLPLAQKKDVGVIAMKVFGHGELKKRELALRYSLGLPGVALAILGMKSQSEIDENLRLAHAIKPLEQSELDTLIGEARKVVEKNAIPTKDSPLFWLYDLKTMAWQDASEPVTVSY